MMTTMPNVGDGGTTTTTTKQKTTQRDVELIICRKTLKFCTCVCGRERVLPLESIVLDHGGHPFRIDSCRHHRRRCHITRV